MQQILINTGTRWTTLLVITFIQLPKNGNMNAGLTLKCTHVICQRQRLAKTAPGHESNGNII